MLRHWGFMVPRGAGDDFDFELESRQPVDSDCCHVAKRLAGKRLSHGLQNQTQARFGIYEKNRQIDYIVKRAVGRFQNSPQILECELHLFFQVGLGRAILAGTHHPGNKQ